MLQEPLPRSVEYTLAEIRYNNSLSQSHISTSHGFKPFQRLPIQHRQGTMGNASSSQALPPSEASHNDQKKASVKPPDQWVDESNFKPFQPISPASDLSNPSQFRHRYRKEMVQQTPISSRRRTSKVMSKQSVKKTRGIETSLPPPSLFYFPTSRPIIEKSIDASTSSSLRRSITSQKPSNRARRWRIHRNGKKQVRNKAQRAKQVFSSCWAESRILDCAMGKHHLEHEALGTVEGDNSKKVRESNESKRYSATSSRVQKEPSDCPQFNPGAPASVKRSSVVGTTTGPHHTDWREGSASSTGSTEQDLKDRYLHDQGEYLERIVDKSQASSTPNNSHYASQKIADNASDCDNVKRLFMRQESDDKQEASSPVAHLFEEKLQCDSPYDDDVSVHKSPDVIQDDISIISSLSQRPDISNRNETNALPRESMARNSTTSKEVEGYLERCLAEEKAQQQIEKQLMAGRGGGQRQSLESSQMSHHSQRKKEGKGNQAMIVTSEVTESHDIVLKQSEKVLKSNWSKLSDYVRSGQDFQMRRTISSDTQSSSRTDCHKTMKEQELCSSARLSSEKPRMNKITVYSVPMTYPKASLKSKEPPAVDVALDVSRRSTDSPSTSSWYGKFAKTDCVRTMTTAATILQQTYPMAAVLSQDDDDDKENRLSNYLHGRSCLRQYSPSVNSVVSVPTPASEASRPAFGDDVMKSAAFLFSPSFCSQFDNKQQQQQNTIEPHHHTTTFSLSTYDSRSRISSKAIPITIPISESFSIEEASKESDRRVRFSEDAMPKESFNHMTQPDNLEIPRIEHKLSDLTDYTSRDFMNTLVSASSIQEGEDEEREPLQATNKANLSWSYNGDDGGVTPLRSGKGPVQPTNSPFIRFTQARKMFMGHNDKCTNARNSVPIMQTKGIVHSRITAMETQRASQVYGTHCTSNLIAPTVDSHQLSIMESDEQSFGEIKHSNPIDDYSADDASEYSSNAAKSPILSSSVLEDDTDDFAAILLQHTGTFDDESTVDDTTISTVRRERSPSFYAAGQYTGFQRNRLSTSESSYSSSSTLATGTTVSTLRQRRLSLVSSSDRTSISSMPSKSGACIAFRNEASVKPIEQIPKFGPGTTPLGATTGRTPVHAMKWRALAAAAKEKDGKRSGMYPSTTISQGSHKSLSERNMNVMSSSR
jgi:hypothetical protein